VDDRRSDRGRISVHTVIENVISESDGSANTATIAAGHPPTFFRGLLIGACLSVPLWIGLLWGMPSL
jgi:hypothetical protein